MHMGWEVEHTRSERTQRGFKVLSERSESKGDALAPAQRNPTLSVKWKAQGLFRWVFYLIVWRDACHAEAAPSP